MSNYRSELSKSNKYYLPAQRTMELIHFCRQYPLWKKALESLDSLSKRPDDLDLFSKYHDVSDPTARCAMARQYYDARMTMVEKAAYAADAELGSYILKAAIEGISYEILERKYSIPCCREVYYDRRRKFLWELSKARN